MYKNILVDALVGNEAPAGGEGLYQAIRTLRDNAFTGRGKEAQVMKRRVRKIDVLAYQFYREVKDAAKRN